MRWINTPFESFSHREDNLQQQLLGNMPPVQIIQMSLELPACPLAVSLPG